MTDTTPEQVPEGWRLHDNRWATLTLGDTSIRVRPPKLGEYRLIDNAAKAVGDVLEDLAERVRSEAADLDKLVQAGEMPQATASIRSTRLSQDFDDAVNVEWHRVLLMAIENLGDAPVPPEDDWPLWFIASSARQLGILNSHWKLCPPPRGAASP